jgi:autotransporter-associated beta strand protein
MDVFSGTVTNFGWLVMARGDTNEIGVLNVFGGLMTYAGGGISDCWGGNQTAIVNVLGGVVSNSIAVGINLNRMPNATNTGVLNLNGGTVQANSVSGAAGQMSFNGGTLKASGANTVFVSGLASAMIYSNGATINNNGVAVTFNQPLLAPTGKGVNGIASFTSGAGYISPPIIIVNRGGGDTTGVGATAIAQIDRNAGTVTNIIITCPGVNYTVTPTFTLSGGGAATPATITGQAPTTNISGDLTVTGAGAVTLAGGNTYSGNTFINSGTLRVGRPVLQMTFDNVVGSTVVNQGSGGSAMNGTLSGTATITSGGRFGSALSISSGAANGGYVLISSSVVPLNYGGAWTVGMWIKTSTTGGADAYQGDGSWASGNTSFYLNSGGTSSGTKGGGVRYAQGWEQGTATLNDGNWHHVVLTCNNGTKIQYVDGAIDSLVANAWNSTGTGGQFWIGGTADTGDGNVGLNGLIDEVYVYDRALTLSEVQSLYSTNKIQALPVTTPVTVASGAIYDLNGISQTIASLSGAGKVTNSAGQSVTLTVSNNTGTATFSGNITDLAATNSVSLIQNGVATTILSGANTYRGTTTIRGGSFLVNGSLGTNTVTVTNGGTLGGNGTISGTVTIQNNGNLSPGSGIGKLTVSSAVLQAGGTTLMEISKSPATNDQLVVTGALTFGGTLTVMNLAGTLAANDSFQLFSAGSIGGTFAATNLPPLNAGLGWSLNTASGVLSVVQTVATNATSITYSVGGGSMILSWPADHIGWRLQVQTNALVTGLGTNWFDMANSTTTNQIVIPIGMDNGSVFYRLLFP